MGVAQALETTDDDLVAALTVLRAADDGGTPIDNAALGVTLGWDAERVGRCIGVAKKRSFIWGVPGPQRLGSWFSEIEVTVQGRRYLQA